MSPRKSPVAVKREFDEKSSQKNEASSCHTKGNYY